MRKEDMHYDIFCGIDIGKEEHYLVALSPLDDTRILSCPLAQDQEKIEGVLSQLASMGKVLVVVDQHGCIGRLVVAVAQAMGIDVAHISPRNFKKAADTYGELKTDAFDAFVIADVARSLPRMIESVVKHPEVIEELKVLCSFRADTVKERTAAYNRLHDCLHKVSPPLEHLFAGEGLHTEIALALLARYGGPLGFRRAGQVRVCRWASNLKHQRSQGPAKVAEVFAALSEVTVALPGAAILEDEIKVLAFRIKELNALADRLKKQIIERSALVPEVELLMSMPGCGDVLAPSIISEIGDIERFEDADHFASYGGVAPKKKESGKSVKGAKKAKGGNRRLKNALVQLAWSSCSHNALSRAYYDKKRAENKSHKQALLALARRQAEVIFAMLKTGTYYQSLSKAA
jgi:transposase